MKARLQPLYSSSEMDNDYKSRLETLRNLLQNEAIIYEPVKIGSCIGDVDAIVFPQLSGDIFKHVDLLKEKDLPFLIVTSDFGTVNMWDWEIVTFLKTKGFKVLAPYSLELTKKICTSLALKREMKKTKFLMFQDNPGVGMQSEIFKRFYWWEEECSKSIMEKFGILVLKKSYKELAEKAKDVPDKIASQVAEQKRITLEKGLESRALLNAIKMYIVLKEELSNDDSIKGMGINCLNESFYSNTTPCLAWSLLYEEEGLIWACEADILSLMTMYLINKSVGSNVIMSNVYPFLMGMAALQHEKIDNFPEVAEPENYLLVAHCGYFGMIPNCMADDWILRRKVLEIVSENAISIDARLPLGDVLITKLHPNLDKIMVVNGKLENYVQYPGSDCRNGGLIKVEDGYRLMDLFYSHHNCIIPGGKFEDLNYISKIFDIEIVK